MLGKIDLYQKQKGLKVWKVKQVFSHSNLRKQTGSDIQQGLIDWSKIYSLLNCQVLCSLIFYCKYIKFGEKQGSEQVMKSIISVIALLLCLTASSAFTIDEEVFPFAHGFLPFPELHHCIFHLFIKFMLQILKLKTLANPTTSISL